MNRLLLCICIIMPYLVFSQTVHHWESIIQTGDSCRYLIPNSDIGTQWIQPGFDESIWTKGKGGVGFGDNDDSTTIVAGISSVYIRYSFQIIDKNDIATLLLYADYDDGFIAYLNGTEIARANVSNPVSWNMELQNLHEAALYAGGLPECFEISNLMLTSILVEGTNILAVEIHNEKATSSDLSSNMFLQAGIKSDKYQYRPLPVWFDEPVMYVSFNLPLVNINTNGINIPNEPKISAQMGLTYNGEGLDNYLSDIPNVYNGQIGIELRGESSQDFPKKSYSIELRMPDGSNNNVSILGLPKENDFVLYAPYSDKTMTRNVLSYQLYREMGNWAPHTRYIELIVNDDYKGIYVLTEKIKVDKNRVNINKLDEKDTTAIDISGGYILRRDKITNLQKEEYWASPVKQIYSEPLTYQYYDPEYAELTTAQRQYPKDWMKTFDLMMSGSSYADKSKGYYNYINIKSFVDMLVLNEFTKGIDSYMFSSYFYKQNDSEGGKLVAGPPWDMDLTMGNLNYGGTIPYFYSWIYPDWSRVYWWKRLMEDQNFKNQVYCSWNRLRTDALSTENIEFIIDSCATHLGNSVERNFSRFPILGTYVWPNLLYPKTYEEEIVNMKTWIQNRLSWLDSEWGNKCITTGIDDNIPVNLKSVTLGIYPNPSDFKELNVSVKTPVDLNKSLIEMVSLQGVVIERISIDFMAKGECLYHFSDHTDLPAGVYFLRFKSNEGMNCSEKVIKIN